MIKQSLNKEDIEESYWYRKDKPYQEAMLKTIRAIEILVGCEARDEVERNLSEVEDFWRRNKNYVKPE